MEKHPFILSNPVEEASIYPKNKGGKHTNVSSTDAPKGFDGPASFVNAKNRPSLTE